MGAWAHAGWRVGDLGNGTIMLQKLFNPDWWQIIFKSFLLPPFLIDFSFSPTAEISRLELEFEERLPRKTESRRGLDRSQMEQPIKKNKFSYFARSCLRLHPQEIWERDYFHTVILCRWTPRKRLLCRLWTRRLRTNHPSPLCKNLLDTEVPEAAFWTTKLQIWQRNGTE